jgi:hypothetical protein
MITSTIPMAERLDWHPVHRAAAVLRQGLLSSAATSPDPAEIWDASRFCVSPAATDLSHGPVNITYPTSLAPLLGLPSITTDDDAACQPPVTQADDLGAAVAPVGDALEGDGVFDRTTQLQLQGLVQAFYRRQRQASLLVACSVATAVALTFGGLVLLFSVTDRAPAKHEDAPRDVTSIAHAERRAAVTPPPFQHISVRTNQPAKAPLLIRAKAGGEAQAFDEAAPPTAQMILINTGRPLALAPLLPLGSARYLLLRGLPEEAKLSAGRQTGSGTWMVKGADVPDLTLTVGDSANGDYPLEIYRLDTGDGLQARRRLVLRVDQTPQFYAAGFSLGWPGARPEARREPDAKAEPVVASATSIEPGVLRERAQRLLGEGDMPAARLILTQLAERGQADAAYELALTYDLEVLVKAGVHGVDGDPAIARAWYERAAQAGHAGAGARLHTLAKLRGGA